MAREAISLFLDVPVESVEVRVEAVLPAKLDADVKRAKAVRTNADILQKEAAGATARAARALVKGAPLTVRDAGTILGVPHQRIAQLLHQ